ncbi:hypothetical protein AGABI2DRAFT_191974 [Agaricus bisporus var. bisporus H97]|uniref:hypothetical protein n=1 Tax=Agaricus bisporus var. bisporus (strain H97 / ATCC MYA-4626 / FGSC 10389) TaxID=936046 RepID=UPI00029F5A15|nr:hypothetical protein AGABI2DRAFT_191974 [Agaricus bisporus var. bisporus H97]EKV48345.1 hypothetical protein AGABI2DRAFT_191974 [Agaricus bisporus var. bisporus H97]
MSLFEVTGWSVGAKPVKETRDTPSKKRKRSPSEQQVNFDKIMNKLKSRVGVDETKKEKTKSSKRNKRGKESRPKSGTSDVSELNISRPKLLKPRISVDEESVRPAKKAKTRRDSKRDSASPTSIASALSLTSPTSTPAVTNLTPLQQGMRHSLDGARFRMINETLYKSESREAHRLMQQDRKVYEEYHAGFRHQVQSWPTNPVDHYINLLSSYPPRTVIADLGCGDATLAKALTPRGLNVVSYDLVSDREYVIEADVSDRIPLPGSEGSGREKTIGSAQVVDVVVCALSLMGTNWPMCLREAWRILKPEGELKIAEVTSRFTDVEEFKNLVGSIGFRFKSKDERNTHFILFEFKKAARKGKSDSEWEKLMSKGEILKACEYKRR